MRRILARDWMDDGFRTWKLDKFKWFGLRYDFENVQGDFCERITLHLAGRAFQYSCWDVVTPYRIQTEKPKPKKKSMWILFKEQLDVIGDNMENMIGVGFVLLLIAGLLGGVYGLRHFDESQRLHLEHDTYVFNQEICDVHHGWYVPSENIAVGLTACRRLSDHSLFYVQNTGREMIPNVE